MPPAILADESGGRFPHSLQGFCSALVGTLSSPDAIWMQYVDDRAVEETDAAGCVTNMAPIHPIRKIIKLKKSAVLPEFFKISSA